MFWLLTNPTLGNRRITARQLFVQQNKHHEPIQVIYHGLIPNNAATYGLYTAMK